MERSTKASRYYQIPSPWPKTYQGRLACTVRGALLALKEMEEWETLEIIQRYAHLSAGHLTEHETKIDTIIGRNVTNTPQEEKVLYLKAR